MLHPYLHLLPLVLRIPLVGDLRGAVFYGIGLIVVFMAVDPADVACVRCCLDVLTDLQKIRICTVPSCFLGYAPCSL